MRGRAWAIAVRSVHPQLDTTTADLTASPGQTTDYRLGCQTDIVSRGKIAPGWRNMAVGVTVARMRLLTVSHSTARPGDAADQGLPSASSSFTDSLSQQLTNNAAIFGMLSLDASQCCLPRPTPRVARDLYHKNKTKKNLRVVRAGAPRLRATGIVRCCVRTSTGARHHHTHIRLGRLEREGPLRAAFEALLQPSACSYADER
jgi:hypothetical protein